MLTSPPDHRFDPIKKINPSRIRCPQLSTAEALLFDPFTLEHFYFRNEVTKCKVKELKRQSSPRQEFVLRKFLNSVNSGLFFFAAKEPMSKEPSVNTITNLLLAKPYLPC